MLNNQNSIKVPGGPIRLSLLKVSRDTCRRSAAVFKNGIQSHRIGWPVFTHAHAQTQREDGSMVPTVCATMLKIEYYKPYWQGKMATLQR